MFWFSLLRGSNEQWVPPLLVIDDPELEAIRQRRMQELMAKHGSGNQQNGEQQKAQEEAKREAEEHRQLMLSQILSAQARERRNQELILVHAEKCILGNNVISRKGLRRWVNELARNPKGVGREAYFTSGADQQPNKQTDKNYCKLLISSGAEVYLTMMIS
ncbi:hypothetical protein GW17_00027617 [Ensete ventricosum]|nr:hypothetical protein GW17_00027617 [Ensete ventricosum]RZR78800.1 hypothetical protein BHM03_00004322 [Ensete ventricosum]